MNESQVPDPVGAVMVVGGGIAGMQAALDLAEQGFKVYLVEEKTAIGGKMAQLDKTFPTNDCAMCNISPKLVDTSRNLNIEILTDTDVLDVSGEAGKFTVNLLRRPRFIDISKCIGCGDCAKVCPVSVPDTYEIGLKTRQAAYRLYNQAVPAAYAIDKLGTAPCRGGCPAGQRAQGYIALIAEGRYREALRAIKEDNPFPSVCGRTCHHPCEGKCSRALVDEPVGIMSLKRFVVDYAEAYGREPVQPAARTQSHWIAVVGAGPAGLTAAHDLVKMGYGVTVYEALPVAGGMMRAGIPAHRLPKGVLQQDIDDILSLGVILKTNSPVKDPAKLLEQGYDAVCLATGISARDLSIGIPGEDAAGVLPAATFLRKINLGEPVKIGERVAVVGGWITAMDAASVARRLGAAEVFLFLDRPRGELPAYQWEIEAAEVEGIHLIERKVVVRILTENGQVTGVEAAEPDQKAAGEGRSRRPGFVAGSEYAIPVDTVIATAGQYSDLSFLDPSFDDLPADKKTLASSIPGLFVVGGRKTGASFIVDAVELGHRVARSIHAYLQDEAFPPPNGTTTPVVKFTRQELAKKVQDGEIKVQPRFRPALIPLEERVTSFREVVLGLTEHQARAEASRCLQCGICSECLACEYACGVDAIDHQMVAHQEQVQVGAVVLAPGYQVYNAALSEEYGFGRYPNVVNALQFERLLSASGPTQGHVLRPSDQKPPRRIAFLQCIGSRDQSHDYCSSVCCMYATKEAVIAKEHQPELDVQVFMMDMRAFSKGYWNYFERARDRYGVVYRRSRISSIVERPDHCLVMRCADESGQPVEELFDMVVLSVGMEISPAVRDLGRRLGIELDEHGFCRTVSFNPVETTRQGIYAVGPFRSPKDIPDSVVEASSAAGAAAASLAQTRFSLTRHREYPPERDVSQDEPHIGVFVCSCGSNIGGFVDVPAVAASASSLPNVVHSEWNMYACSQDSIRNITARVQELGLNRVVVASCSPLTHQPLFQDSIRAAGLNPYLFEMANIRNQCSWVHSHDKEVATRKADGLVRMAVARSALLNPLYAVDVPVGRAALVVGGGAAGMAAALNLAEQGFPVHLVERESELGGNLRRIYTSFEPGEGEARHPQAVLRSLIERTMAHPEIHVYLKAEAVHSSGFLGNFATTIRLAGGGETQVRHGATILATGGREYSGPEYGYGKNPQVITQLELEARLCGLEAKGIPDSLVMLQCVGPAEKYCSRICCSTALKNALHLLDLNPEARVTILYQDMRAYGFKERLYREARQRGVLFIRYDQAHAPQIVEPDDDRHTGGIVLEAWDPALRKTLRLPADLLVLSMPVVPQPDAGQVAARFKASTDADGFFLEAHVKLRPVDFASDGVFMAGLAHYPKLLDEAIIQAQAAAARAARVLSRSSLSAGGRVAVVHPEMCTGCLTCLRICPFGVPVIRADLAGAGKIAGAAYIEPAVCQGCGSCAAECPARAIQLMHYTDVQMAAKTGALLNVA